MTQIPDNGTGPRRRQVVAGAAGIAAATLFRPAIARAQGTEPIKIGLVYPKQGTFADLGEGAAAGATLMLEQAGSRILGRPARVIWLDDPNPQSAQQNMQKLIEEEKVTAVLGGASGATALALSALAKRAKIPFITLSGATMLTGKDCNRYTFRCNAPAPVAVRAIAPVLLERGKRWYFLMPDYAFGQDVYAAYKAFLDAAGGQQVGYDKTPLGTADFSGFILKIRQARPDVVVTALSGNDLPLLLKQYADFGMKDGAPISSPIITDTDIVNAGTQASGIYGKVWHYEDSRNSDADNAFTKAYTAKMGRPPHANAFLASVSMRLMLAGIEKAGSARPDAIVRALESVRIEDDDFPIFFREWDHQLMHRTVLLKVRPQFTDPWKALEVIKSAPDAPAGLDALYGAQSDSACALGDI
ncbi:ABC transporter substrate-binding protein [Roseomonas marmotae]|uniref:ABC transporter substrate-binding protein n=1 Tax=Roseomonas marmotae TaxID=2768161 RepID=A0ABS3KKV2_9PROT|nr:ABC transporter substrate-binding protein [Roseomonas marmotae]MBO1077223.1 ABC transporter substrate-binding protein [Roseomonas marmotae]